MYSGVMNMYMSFLLEICVVSVGRLNMFDIRQLVLENAHVLKEVILLNDQ